MKILTYLLCFTILITFFIPVVDAKPTDEIASALFESDIASAREALDGGLITCVELIEYFLERIEATNETFNCFITLCDNALEQAAERDEILCQNEENSMLLGIPIVVKDNISYEGYPTTNGLWSFGSVSWENATVVQTLLDAGAVVLGKTNMATEAQDAQFTASDAIGETPNAYDPGLSAGGSSGGSAVAVSLNYCYAGLGTDTNASLRYPAVLNGCISLRPTEGFLDREGIELLNYRRDVPGVITRSVTDQAIVLGEMAGIDYYSSLDPHALEGKRIGILTELTYSDTFYDHRKAQKVDKEIEDAFHEAVSRLKALGATVFPVSIPDLYSLSASCAYESSAAISRYLEKYEMLFAERDLDAVIFPTYVHTPDQSLSVTGWIEGSSDHFYSNCSLVSSALGVPEIAIPIAYHSMGSGIGMEIAALKGQEELLLNLAYAYTEGYPSRRIPETAPNLYPAGATLEQLLYPEETTAPTEELLPVEESTAPAEVVPTESVEQPIESEEEQERSPFFTVILWAVVLIPAGIWLTVRKRKHAIKQ